MIELQSRNGDIRRMAPPADIPAVAERPLASALETVGHMLHAKAAGCHLEQRCSAPTTLACVALERDGVSPPSPDMVATLETHVGTCEGVYFDRPTDPKVLSSNEDGAEGRPGAMRSVIIYAGSQNGARVFVSLLYDQGEDETAHHRAEWLQPLIAQQFASLLTNMAQRRHIANLEAAADRLSVGMVVIDDRRTIAFMNACARSRLADRGAQDRFDDTLVRLRASDSADAMQSRVFRGGSCDGSQEQRLLLMTLVPLEGSAAGADEGPCSLVLLTEPDWRPPIEDLIAFGAVYGLTPVESELAAKLAHCEPISDAAAKLNISVNTARAYLKSIFTKTQVHRQQDLVRLFTSGRPPLFGADDDASR